MLKLANQHIQILHVESTDACNAACPQCSRELDQAFDKNDLHHLTVDQIKNLIDEDTIRQLNKMYMCGNYGDAAAGRHTLELYQYFRKINPNIILGMNSNGGLRTTDWWKELAKLLNAERDYVVFSIDGLEDTNHIYRINVNWNRLMENIQAFISAGGTAHWDMLVFKHNQHQVDACQELAKSMGFKWFRAKVSKRFYQYPIDFLQPPVGWKDPVTAIGEIRCQAINDQSAFISAQGNLYPCCWVGERQPSTTLDQFDDIVASWGTDQPNAVCTRTCMKNTTGTSFTNQWQREVAL
jgi:MoaA/NifB/PqqE/SkfB family radical SAM enzyme